MTRTPPREELERRGLRPKRHFGQNFLVNEAHARRIAELATSPAGGTVVEVGAGLGALTVPLLDRAARVIAVERDRDLAPILRANLAQAIDAGRLEVLEADAKQMDVAALVANEPPPRVLAGNLPYAISGPVLRGAVESRDSIDRVVFLVQLEVAARLTARPSTPSYGALTVFAQTAFEVRRDRVVRRGSFYPVPAVDSAVVVFEPRPAPVAQETQTFRALVHSAFEKRRKKLRNAWRGVLDLSDDDLEAAATRARVSLDDRGETLTPERFAAMAAEVGT